MRPRAMLIGVEDSGWELVAGDLALHPDLDVVSDGDGVLATNEGDRALHRFDELLSGDGRVGLEVAPGLLGSGRSELLAQRALETLGRELRLIVVLRHPIDRLRFAHRRRALLGKAPVQIGAALQEQADLVDDSRYDQLVAPWFDRFHPWSIHVIVEEQYRAAPVENWRLLCKHLGLADSAPVLGRRATLRRRMVARQAETGDATSTSVDAGPLRRALRSINPPAPAVLSDETLAWLEPELALQARALSHRLSWDDNPWFANEPMIDLGTRLDLAESVERVDLSGSVDLTSGVRTGTSDDDRADDTAR